MPAQPTLWALSTHRGVCGKGCVCSLRVVWKPYRQRWGAPAHVGLPAPRGCRRGESSKPSWSRSWWHWSESWWSYWWGSEGNLLLESNTQRVQGSGWETTHGDMKLQLFFIHPATPPYHKYTCTQPHMHTLPTQGVNLQTSQKKKKKKWA